jgi:hypothetical protein
VDAEVSYDSGVNRTELERAALDASLMMHGDRQLARHEVAAEIEQVLSTWERGNSQ